MTVKEAAPLLGMSEQYLRDLMRLNLIDLGFVGRIPGKKHYHYIIYPEKLERYLGGKNDS